MVVRILYLPFVVAGKLAGAGMRVLGVTIRHSARACRFVISRVTGAAAGSLIGLLLGQRHVGIRLGHRKWRSGKG